MKMIKHVQVYVGFLLHFLLLGLSGVTSPSAPAATDPSTPAAVTCSSVLMPVDETSVTQISPSTHAMITSSLKKDFVQRYSSEPIQQLRQLGASREELVALTRPLVRESLDRVKRHHPTLKLSVEDQGHMRSIGAPNVLTPGASISDFEAYFRLEPERTAVSQFLDFSEIPLRDFSTAVESLKIAILSEQPDLAREAYLQCFRFNKFPDLIALAMETNNSEMLLQIGRLSVARYLFYDRNVNYLNDGLSALLEVQGTNKDEAVNLLLSLNDLMVSGAIMVNEESVNTFGIKGSKIRYYEDGLISLISAGQLYGRFPRDSASHHRIVTINDPRIAMRLRDLIDRSVNDNVLLDPMNLLNAISALGDSEYSGTLASRIYERRGKISVAVDERQDELGIQFLGNFSLKLAMLSKSPELIRSHIDRLIQSISDETLPLTMNDDVVFIPIQSLKIAQEHISRLLLENLELNPFQEKYLKQSLSELIKGQSRKSKIRPNLERVGLFLRDDNFEHHIETIEYGFKYGSTDQGNWGRFINALEARDTKGLIAVYETMMKNGRALEAVYVAISLAAIELGEDLPALRALLKMSPSLLDFRRPMISSDAR